MSANPHPSTDKVVSLDTLPRTPPPPEIADIIRGRMGQYCELADKNQWSRFAEITTEDAKLQYCKADGSYMSSNDRPWNFTRSEFIEFCTAAFKDAQYMHMVGPGTMGYEPATDSTPATVKSIFNGMYYVGAPGESGPFSTGGGYYHGTWVEEGGRWLLKHLIFYRNFYKLP